MRIGTHRFGRAVRIYVVHRLFYSKHQTAPVTLPISTFVFRWDHLHYTYHPWAWVADMRFNHAVFLCINILYSGTIFKPVPYLDFGTKHRLAFEKNGVFDLMKNIPVEAEEIEEIMNS